MTWLWGGIAVLVIYAVYRMWREDKETCPHHWEPIGMIDWQCRECGRIVDGAPPARKGSI